MPPNSSLYYVLLRIGLLAIVGALCLGVLPATAAAAPVHPHAAIQATSDDEVQFLQLGFQDRTLRSSTDEAKVFFILPSTWNLQPATKLLLHYAVKITGPMVAVQSSDPNRSVAYSASLQVRLNGKSIAYFPITQDMDSVVEVALSADDLRADAARSTRNSISFTISDNVDCIGISPVELTIFNNSLIVLPHTLSTIVPELMSYPFPLIQQTFDVQGVTLVVPQQPSSVELAAAFAAAASLRNIDKNAPFNLVRVDDLTEDQRATTHIVLIGQPSRLPLLSGVTLPAAFEGDRFPSLEIGDNDGVVQIAVSPWSNQHALLLVSGATEGAVLQAAQGLNTLRDQAQPQRPVAIITAVRAAQPIDFPLDRATFSMLQIPSMTLRGLGTSSTETHFTLSAEQARYSAGTLNVSLTHSALLNASLSNFTLELNGIVVGNVRLADETAQGRAVTMRLPTTALKPGDNRLVVSALMRSISNCGKPSGDDIWMTIHDDTAFSITRDGAGPAALPFSLDRYPAPFSYHPDLAELAFVLPQDDAQAWNIAQRITMYLADIAGSRVVSPTIVFANTPPEALRKDLNMIIVGQPKALPLLAEFADKLPVVFAPDTNTPDDRRSRVVIHFAPPDRQGYIQMVQSPWNPLRAVLTVLGRDNEELRWAGDGLSDSTLRRKLSGQLALVQADVVITPQLIPTEQNPVPPASALAPAAQPTARPAVAASAPDSAAAEPAAPSQSISLLPLLVMLLMIVSAGVLGVRMWLSQREVS